MKASGPGLLFVGKVLITNSVSLLVIRLFRFSVSLSILKDNFMSIWEGRIDYQKVSSYPPQPLLPHCHHTVPVADCGHCWASDQLPGHFQLDVPQITERTILSFFLPFAPPLNSPLQWMMCPPTRVHKPETWRSVLKYSLPATSTLVSKACQSTSFFQFPLLLS